MSRKAENAERLARAEATDFAFDTRAKLEEQARRVKELDKRTAAPQDLSLVARLQDAARNRLSPRRRRWQEIADFDARVDELAQRQQATMRELDATRERIPLAQAQHEAALVTWLAEGQKGARPESEVAALEQRVAELQADYEALGQLVDKVLAEKAAFVERHRARLVSDAASDTARAKDAYLQAIDALEQARDELWDARRDEVWARLFPSDALVSEAPGKGYLVGGIVKRLREAVPGLNLTLDIGQVKRLLVADAAFVAEAKTPEQAVALQGTDSRRAAGDAIWVQTPEGQAALNADRREARERYEREWGRAPGW